MIRLNSDLGEGFGVYKMGDEEAIMPHIDMANIACGFHAGDPLTLQKTLQLAVKHSVTIGAHPSYPDLVGFGRRSLTCKAEEVEAFVIYQCGALRAMAEANSGDIEYVKPHGALYNDMMQDDSIFEAIVSAISRYDKSLKLMILSTPKNDHYQELAYQKRIELLFEVFADRAYTDDGYLVPRSQEGAVLSSHEEVVARLKTLQQNGYLKSINNKTLNLQTDSLCVHGDNEKAVSLVRHLRETLYAFS